MNPTQRKDGRWQVMVRIAPGPKGRQAIYGSNPNEALQNAREFLAALTAKPTPRFEAGTVAAFVYGPYRDRVWDELRESSRERYNVYLRHHILPALGHLQMSEVTLADITAMMRSLRKIVAGKPSEQPLAAKTRKEILFRTREIFGLAVRLGVIDRNPSDLARVPKSPAKKARHEPDPDFTFKILEAARGTYMEGPIFFALFVGGPRRGEMGGLTWDRIDREKLTITFDRQRRPRHGLTRTKGEPRVIPVPQEIIDALDRLGDKRSIFVFTDRAESDPKPVPLDEVSKRTPRLCDEAGIPRTTYHDLRAHAASNLAAIGCDLVTIQEILGHADLRTTQLYLQGRSLNKRKALADYLATQLGRQNGA